MLSFLLWILARLDNLLLLTKDLCYSEELADEITEPWEQLWRPILCSIFDQMGTYSNKPAAELNQNKTWILQIISEVLQIAKDSKRSELSLFTLLYILKTFRRTAYNMLESEETNDLQKRSNLIKNGIIFFDTLETGIIKLGADKENNSVFINLPRVAYETLKAENERYIEVLQKMPYPMLLLKNDNQVCLMNYAAYSLLQSIDEASNYHILDMEQNYYIDKILPEIHIQLLAFFESGEKERIITQEIVRPSGSQMLLVRYYRLHDNENHTGTSIVLSTVNDKNDIEDKLRYMSFHDALTTLFNRAYFEEELVRLGSGQYDPVGIISIDVDGLKIVNDVLGHQAGDVLLISAANLINGCFRGGDIVARIGGDEFAVLLPESGMQAVERAVERLKEAVANYNIINPLSPVSISQGWAVRDDKSIPLGKIYQEADHKMYQQKPWNREVFLEKFSMLIAQSMDDLYRFEE